MLSTNNSRPRLQERRGIHFFLSVSWLYGVNCHVWLWNFSKPLWTCCFVTFSLFLVVKKRKRVKKPKTGEKTPGTYISFFFFQLKIRESIWVSYLTYGVIFILYMFLLVKFLFIFLNKKDKAFNIFSASCHLSYKKGKRFRIWTGYQVQVHFSQFSCLRCLFSEHVELQTMSSSRTV